MMKITLTLLLSMACSVTLFPQDTTPERNVPLKTGFKTNEAFALTVINGSENVVYPAGTTVPIYADPPPCESMTFEKWTGDIDNVKDIYAANTFVTIPSSAISVTAKYVERSANPIVLPIEIMGLPPYSESVIINLDNHASAKKLWVQVHNVTSNNKARIRINGGNWIALSNHNRAINIAEPDKSYGGFGGGFNTVRFTINTNYINFVEGENTIEFQYYKRPTDVSTNLPAPTAGYRVINFNVLDENDIKLLGHKEFIMDDPLSWEPPLNNAADIIAGKTIFTKTGGCANCHTSDGYDLKYFNISNKTLIEQCRKSGLSEKTGKQVASYIRSLDVEIVPQARVWNPPYQPGPGTDSRPVHEWAAGAGLEWVLGSDAESFYYLFKDGSSANIATVVDTKKTFNTRENPIAVQFPDWLEWIPRVHPKDIFDDFENSTIYGEYIDLKNKFEKDDLANSKDLLKEVESFGYKLMKWVGEGQVGDLHAWCALDGTHLNQAVANGYTMEFAKFNIAKWHTIKLWELLKKYDAEDKMASLYDFGEKYEWPSREFAVFQYAAHFIGDRRSNSIFKWESEVVGTYNSSIWYELQMVLANGHRDGHNERPVDWSYNYFHVNRIGERSGIYEPMRMYRNIIKGWQQRDKPGPSEINKNTWVIREISPWRLYSDSYGDQRTFEAANDIQDDLRAKVTGELIKAWLEKSNEYKISEWPRTAVGEIKFQDSDFWAVLEWADCDPTYLIQPAGDPLFALDGASDAVEAIAFWRVIPRFLEIGVDPNIVSDLAKWANSVWTNPATDWEQWMVN